jgi:ribosomal protein S27E
VAAGDHGPLGLDRIGKPTLEGPDAMHCSFRLALQQLTKLVREAQASNGDRKALKRVERQIRRSLDLDRDTKVECDHCGHEQQILPGTTGRVKCRSCKKTFTVETDAA